MKLLLKSGILFLSLIGLAGCIDPYDLKVDDQEKILVVNGMITDEPGPYTVKLTTTFKYGAFFSDIDPSVENAVVTITDETGFSEVLKHKSPGVYETSPTGIQGRPGGKYTLKINLKNGREYLSETETLQPAPAIDRLYASLKPVQEISKNGGQVTNTYVQFRIDAKDNPGKPDYYRWAFNSTNEVTTQPENYTKIDKKGNQVPAPKDCCSQCWLSTTNTVANILDDRQFDGNDLIGHQVALIPFAPQYFENKYFIEVKQYGITPKAFIFWQTLNSQISETGSIQEPAPANAVSNIKNINNPDEMVLGYFSSAGVAKKSMFVEPYSLGLGAGRFIFPDDCRVIIGATTNRPSFW